MQGQNPMSEDSFLNMEAADLFRKDQKLYEEKVREWTKLYAVK